MTKFVHVGITVTEDYSPLIAMIDAIARDNKTSRSAIIRDKLSEMFKYTPENIVHKYNSSALIGLKQ